MVERRTPISVTEAVQRVMQYAKKGKKEFVRIEESEGRFLAERLIATHDVPPFNRSPYDGFAIRAIDSMNAKEQHPIQFEIIDEIGAGQVCNKSVGPNQAVRIMTGAQLPEDCDAIVMYELTKEFQVNGKSYMSIKRPFEKWSNISFKGEDTQKGTELVQEGILINPGVMALLATFGYSEVPVVKRPIIGILSTGTELLEVHEELQPGKIRNSNAYMIYSQVKRSGAIPKLFAQKSDDLELCYQAVLIALQEVDFLITTGGVSVGDYDYLPEIYRRLGANVLFNKVAMRPGSVTTVAEKDGQLLFGLSGNPSACFVGYELFVRPIVKFYLHSKTPHLKKVKAFLGKDFPKANPFTRFVRSQLLMEEGKLYAFPVGLDKSSMVTALSNVNSLIVLPGGSRGFQKEMLVDVLLLDNLEGSEWPWEQMQKSYK